MARNLIFELGSDVAQRLQRLTLDYREASPEATVARALGLLEAIEPYLHDGLLTIVDPKAGSGNEGEREVDFEFEGLAKPAPISTAA